MENVPAKLAREEYYFCQTAANDIDRQTLSFKNWSVAVSIALMGWAFGKSEPLAMSGPLFAALLFWYSEGLWKEKNKIFTDRVKALEPFLNGQSDALKYKGPQLSKIHLDHYKDRKPLFPKRLFYTSVMMPHLAVVLICIGLIIYRMWPFLLKNIICGA